MISPDTDPIDLARDRANTRNTLATLRAERTQLLERVAEIDLVILEHLRSVAPSPAEPRTLDEQLAREVREIRARRELRREGVIEGDPRRAPEAFVEGVRTAVDTVPLGGSR